MPKVVALEPHIGARGVDRFLHHVAQLAGGLHAAFARQHDRFDGERFAAHFRPGQAGDDADLILAFHLAVAELAHAGIIAEIVRRHFDRRELAGDDFLHRLAREIGDLALEIAHAGFARVIADEIAQSRRR